MRRFQTIVETRVPGPDKPPSDSWSRSHQSWRWFFFSQRLVGPWNSIPESTRRSEKVNGFKSSYDEWAEGRWLKGLSVVMVMVVSAPYKMLQKFLRWHELCR